MFLCVMQMQCQFHQHFTYAPDLIQTRQRQQPYAGPYLLETMVQIVQLTGQLEALQQEHHRLTGSHMDQEKQNSLLQEECAQLQVLYTYCTVQLLHCTCLQPQGFTLLPLFCLIYFSWHSCTAMS